MLTMAKDKDAEKPDKAPVRPTAIPVLPHIGMDPYRFRPASGNMSRSYPANTQVQKFLEESYNKERDARLGWFFAKTDDQKGSKQLEVFRKRLEAAAPKPNERLLELRDVKPKSFNKRKIKADDNLLKLAQRSTTSADLLTDMRPVTGGTRDKLYDGFTKEGRGRYQYLMDRYQTIPEKKYQFPVLSSWDYGWRLEDVIRKEDIKKPAFGRTRIVADTFYTRTGCLPDPPSGPNLFPAN